MKETSIAILAGGIGAAKFIDGVSRLQAFIPGENVRVIINVGDDSTMHGLYICPDFDIIAYTLAGIVDPVKKWGIQNDTFNCLSMLELYTDEPQWFSIGDKDFATHLFRTKQLGEGKTLTGVALEIQQMLNVRFLLLPCTDDTLRTMIHTVDGDMLEFEEYFVREKAMPEVESITFKGKNSAKATPQVLETLSSSKKIIIAPSNPYLSIDPILATGGIMTLLEERKKDVSFISPIINGKAIKGPTTKLMKQFGLETSCVEIARHYNSVASTAFIDIRDKDKRGAIEQLGYKVHCCDTLMVDASKKKELARFVLEKLF